MTADGRGPSLSLAAREWARIVGPEFVQTDAVDCAAPQTATYPTRERVLAIVRPGNREEVQACVRVANRFGVPLYPVSSGKNWGYGSRVPSQDESALLDLGRLDRILELDEDLAYVVVEPGVTQRMLYAHLQEHTQGRLWIDATSSSFDCSIIGNMQERGHGVTMYCDHAATAVDLEVVLANGDCIHTGYGAFEGASTRALDAWGLGPSLHGLFSQSNLGIVTRATIWLMRAPEQAEVAFFTVDTDDAFEALVDELRSLRLDRILKSGPFISNVYQSLQKVMTYPWSAVGGATPLPLSIALELAKEHRYSLWNGSIGLYGTREEVAQQKDRLGRALAGKASWSAFVDKDLRDLEQAFPRSRHREVRSVITGFTGGVGGTGLPAAYWRIGGTSAQLSDMDLDRDQCGFKFWTATTPFRGKDARRAAALAEEIILRHGFEPSIGIFPVRERALQFHISCAYDRKVESDDNAILACHAELGSSLMGLGHYPTRLGIGCMGALNRLERPYQQLLRTLKETLDPHGILAPGRYTVSGDRGGED